MGVLTGALGDMTTLGARGRLCLAGGVGEAALAPLLAAPPPLIAGAWKAAELDCMPALGCGPGIGAPAWGWVGASVLGSCLFRDSTRLEVEEVGVAAGD